MKTAPDRLTPLPAGRLLCIWREVAAQEDNETVRGLLCNARVLAESCFLGEAPLFESAEAVLEELTAGEMETLVRHLAGAKIAVPAGVNTEFDLERFRAMREERA